MEKYNHDYIPLPSFRYSFIYPYWTLKDFLSMIKYTGNSSKVNNLNVSRFENELKNVFHLNYVKAFNSGKAAIDVGLKISGLFPGQEIIVPSFACSSILSPIIRNNLVPKFADISYDLNISAESIQDNISDNTVAVIVPHIAGRLAAIEEIEKIAYENNLLLIDDSAQAMGARLRHRYAGSFGDFGIFSLGPGKVIMASAGGVLTINNKSFRSSVEYIKKISFEKKNEVVKRLLSALFLYQFRKYSYPLIVLSNRLNKEDMAEYTPHLMSGIDALLGSNQLAKLDKIIEKRRENARILNENLASVSQITCPEFTPEHIFSNYIIRIEGKNSNPEKRPVFILKLGKYLQKHHIEVSWPYSPLHFSSKTTNCDLKITKMIWNKLLSLPNNPSLNEEDMKYISEIVRKFCNDTFR